MAERTLKSFMMTEMGMKTHDKRWKEFEVCLNLEITQAKIDGAKGLRNEILEMNIGDDLNFTMDDYIERELKGAK